MKDKKIFIESIKTLLYSWGSDTPAEVIWGLNNMLVWIEAEYGVVVGERFMELDELMEDESNEDNNERVLTILENIL